MEKAQVPNFLIFDSPCQLQQGTSGSPIGPAGAARGAAFGHCILAPQFIKKIP